MTFVPDTFYSYFTATNWSACWLWHGATNNAGYGIAWHRDLKRTQPAHRLTYELAYGFVPLTLQVDHLCKTRACVNPLHLEAVTSFENNERSGIYEWNTECLRGHKFTKENTYIRLDRGTQECKACRKDARAEYKRRTGK